MRIISYVCADLYDAARDQTFRIRPADRGVLMEVPDWISADPLFRMLVSDGSVRVAESRAEEKILENNPMAGITVEGKEMKAEPAGQEDEKPARRSARKDAEKADEAPGVKAEEKK